MDPDCRRRRSRPSLGEEYHILEKVNDGNSCTEEGSGDHEEESDVSFFGEEDSVKDEEASGVCSYVGEDSDVLPSACLDVCARQLRKSRPLAANCGVTECENRGSRRLFPFLREKARDFLEVEFFAFCLLPAGGEQHLPVETDVGHVVVALLNDPEEGVELVSGVSEEGDLASRAFGGRGLESGDDIFQVSTIFHSERG
jgi:hypothetical protein